MRSTRSSGPDRPRRLGLSGSRDRGSAVAEFSLVAILLTSIFVVVLQVGIYLYERNLVVASTQSAARFAANADIPNSEGAARAKSDIADALSESSAAGLDCQTWEETGAGGLVLVVVECSGQLPTLVTALGPMLPVTATARVVKEGQ